MADKDQNYSWNFQRIGGLDQVILSSADDIAHLDELDPKLWVALSCPASGLEFDDKTLTLLDTDKDGRIRIPEIIQSVNWLKDRLISLDTVIRQDPELPLAAINPQTETGQRLLITAKAILANIEQATKETISLADLSKSNDINNNRLYNGDGIIPVSSHIDADLQQYITDAKSVMGGVKDASGLDGINNDIAQAFQKSLQDWLNWYHNSEQVTTSFADNTEEVWLLVSQLKDKINDYFLRTELASYAPQAQAALNVDEKYIVPTDNGLLEDAVLAELPLSKVEAHRPLTINSGLNPVWRAKILKLIQLIKPFLASEDAMTNAEWLNIQGLLAPYAQLLASKPTITTVATTIAPSSTIEKLGQSRAQQILDSNLLVRFAELAEKDSKTPASASDIAEVEKLIIYTQHIYRLLLNFVSFKEFFDLDCSSAFQAGRLFIDGRCCTLCIPVSNVGAHTTLANYSDIFLMYCECTRHKPVSGELQKRTIVAAMTAGDSDFLLDGRNGVFIDTDGNDWDAKVVKIIEQPISISQAVWSPYKRLGRFITEQINKWATEKNTAVSDAGNNLVSGSTTPPPVTAAEQPKFDIGKSVGIFAAIGLAIGAIGTALASITSSLFQLQWWQFPLVILAIFIIISGPSVILAWLKLRQRTLAPILEASGWAINSKIKINLYLGDQLTSKAALPANAQRNLTDPMKKRNTRAWVIFAFAIIIGIAAAVSWLWFSHQSSTQATIVETTTTIEQQTTTETIPSPQPSEPASPAP